MNDVDRVRLALVNGGWDEVIKDWFVRRTYQTSWSAEELRRIVWAYMTSMATDVADAIHGDRSGGDQ